MCLINFVMLPCLYIRTNTTTSYSEEEKTQYITPILLSSLFNMVSEPTLAATQKNLASLFYYKPDLCNPLLSLSLSSRLCKRTVDVPDPLWRYTLSVLRYFQGFYYSFVIFWCCQCSSVSLVKPIYFPTLRFIPDSILI